MSPTELSADLLSLHTLQEILTRDGFPLISIYLLMARNGPETFQNVVRLKNALSQVADRLERQNVPAPQVTALLAPARALAEDLNRYWDSNYEGIALFIAPDTLRQFRLPATVPEVIMTGHRFHVTPLVPHLHSSAEFYLLTLSQDAVQLYRGSRNHIAPVVVTGMPTSLDELMKFDQPERQLQYHSAGMKGAVIYHGQGVGGDDKLNKENIRRFMHDVAHHVDIHLGEAQTPLVLAGVEYILTQFREKSQYRAVGDTPIKGSPKEYTQDELRREALRLVTQQAESGLADARALFSQLDGADSSRAVRGIKPALRAAAYGRVDTLFVPLSVPVWGKFDPETARIMLYKESGRGEDLANLAVIHTLRNSGKVYATEGEAETHATLRY